jgi:hypothetical protein
MEPPGDCEPSATEAGDDERPAPTEEEDAAAAAAAAERVARPDRV